MILAASASPETASFLVELGLLLFGLAFLARVAVRLGISPIPLYLVAGLAFGSGGLVPLGFSEEFVQAGSEIGVVLLLFMLGLEYTAEELRGSLKAGLPAGVVDFVLNFTPGLLAGLALGWGPVAAVLLGGVTYISSSGVIAKVLADLERLGNRETPTILSILVIEDLVMAVYLPLVAVLLVGGGLESGLASLGIAVATVIVVLAAALRFGEAISRFLISRSNEVVLLTVLGLTLLVAGVAQRLQVSSAVGAFLVGIALHGNLAERAGRLLGPLRDLFAAVFFVFFGLQIIPSQLPPVLAVAVVLGIVTGLTKLATGWWGAARAGVGVKGRVRAGLTLTARGEFSIVIAGLGVSAGVQPQLGSLAAAYVLLMAIAGPLLARFSDPLVDAVRRRRGAARVRPTVQRPHGEPDTGAGG
jgi:CPA2 family monovalent cation:H+ antiporter-2